MSHSTRTFRPAATVLATLMLAGCAAPDIDTALREANALASPLAAGADARLARGDDQRAAAAASASALLAQPLTQDAAVQLAWANSPAFQAALADHWAELGDARQRGLPGGVGFSFERLHEGKGLELGRLLSVGLFELLTLPQRASIAGIESEQARVRMASSIARLTSATRQAWVHAVAAAEIEAYAVQVNEAAQASVELARRMRKAGNFNRLQEARQQLFEADATARLGAARQAALSTREALVRQLGLTDAQARDLKLLARLPAIPKEPRGPDAVAQSLASQRLDVRLARLQLEAAGRSRGIDFAAALVDAELGARRDTHFDGSGGKSTVRGWELDLRLPVFDWGATRAAQLDARSLAAAQRYEAVSRAAGSQAREAYAAYRTAYAQAKHQLDEVVPLRKAISEENLLRYNGMLIGVFDLLADAREQVGGVIAAIEAQRDFWLADAALSSTLIGEPAGFTPNPASAAAAPRAAEAGH